jgi:peptidoglycan/LPS O-acetylase OafA/YrhL
MAEANKVGAGDTAEKVDAGDTAEKVDAGDTAEKVDAGDKAEKVDAGDKAEKVDAGDKAEKVGAGDKAEKDGFRPDIEGLRGIAVMLVVLFHAGLLSNAAIQLRGGFIGVDLFFVVSGFLITGLLIRERERTGKVSFSRFYARRVRRILPAAAVVLLITIPISYKLVTLLDRGAVMEDGASAALSIANIRFALTTDYFNPVSYSPFLHFWSLGVEEQFYFVWPAILALVAWRRPILGAAAALSLIVVGSFIASVLVTQDNPSTAFYMLPTRAWQLAAGGLLAVGAGSLARLPSRFQSLISQCLVVLGWLALAALLFAAVVLDSETTPYPGTWALVPTLAGVLLIAAGPARLGPGMLLRLPPIRFLGKISYSLYLWHWPFLILGGLFLGGSLALTLTPGQALVLVALSIVAATLSWWLIEEPFRRGRIPLPRPSRVVAAGVSVMLIVAMVGMVLVNKAAGALAAADEPARSNTPGPGASAPPVSYAITSAIRPSLAKAPTDFEKPYWDHCLAFADTMPRSSCVYANVTGTYTVALVGDSHASALFPAVEAVARAHGWRLVVFIKSSCEFVDFPLYSSSLKREYVECATWNDNVISDLQAKPPDLVIITMSRHISTLDPADGNATSEGESVARMIEKLPGESRKVIIQDPPVPWFNVPDCLSAHLLDYRRCAYPRASGSNSGMGQLEKIAAQATGAGLIDLTTATCPGTGDCPVVIDDMIVYRDQQHFTATFATSLGPALDAKLTAVLASP